MPTTPDQADLSSVDQEVTDIETVLSPQFSTAILDRPKLKDVLPLLQSSSTTMAHFACHGTADKSDPSLSKIVLQDWKTHPLDVRALLRCNFDGMQFVYLSACETASGHQRNLREESIHISSAFLMGGVPYSVGSLWSIEDTMSAGLASDFYEALKTRGKDGQVDFGRSAEALHAATLKARNEGVEALLWGAFMHSGA